ncbi:putative ABC transport system permease protein [Promicromonospora umidemergens]|uniref:FtsX-like permease family protein n=1 Tax=Promicromonospora umidemergens TaxID=629679 RepID=A0ABP8WGH1_9MICO|nr:ABC transporter permease [Promicromonospora umidemergens]MCP2284093.1 putative ABC transport system permease protein [Promicromonospora umidemergens]
MATSMPTARFTLGQMRRSTGRLASAGIAILISTVFVTVTLLAGGIIEETARDVVAASYADSDVIVSADEESESSFSTDDVEAVAAVDGVGTVQPLITWSGTLRNGGKGGHQLFAPVPTDPRLSPLELSDGAWPAAADEVALTPQAAERLEAEIGDELRISRTLYPEGWAESEAENPAAELGEPEEVFESLTVTGLADDPYGVYTASGGAAAIPSATLSAWNAAEVYPSDVTDLLVALDSPLADDSVPAALSTAIQDTVGGTGAQASVETTEAAATTRTSGLTGGDNIIFLVFVMAFAAIALMIAAMVITNTFQVLIAQRTRTLALLRCIGAGADQVYRSVLLEAAILGVVASALGTLIGALLTQAALMVAPNFDLGVPIPETITLTPQSIVLPLAVGTVMTVLAALAPARSATRVAPLAALRPSDAPTLGARTGRARLVISVLCILGGIALLGLGASLGNAGSLEVGMVAAVGGVAFTFFGIVLSAVLWLPRVAAGLGALVTRSGPAPRLAVANTLRNPRRTAATSTALLIGVTLVTMMSTGAASARATSEHRLDEAFPYDLSVSVTVPEYVEDMRDAVAEASGVSAAAVVTHASAAIGDTEDMQLKAADPDGLVAVVNVPDQAEELAEGSILLSQDTADSLSLGAGDSTPVSGPSGTVDLTVVITGSTALDQTVTPEDLARVTDTHTGTDIWGHISGDDAEVVLGNVQEIATQVDIDALVVSQAAQAASFRQIVDVVLGIMVGLLAVAVVIALVGVTNTLSLSVIERTKESATLRAIGMSKEQLRGMLAVEGVLIAGVGALVGIVLGLGFGWSGSATALSVMGTVQFAVPWTELALTLGVALIAGLLASVLPARAAARTSPVAALGAE